MTEASLPAGTDASRRRDPLGTARMLGIGLALALMTVVLMPLQLLAIRLRWPLARRLPFVWHSVAARLIGLRLHLKGRPVTERPLLLVANHQSWADIVALGAVMPLSFIAKSEVAGWPIFGLLAKLQRTTFVEREARGRTGQQADAIGERLNAGDAMVLFAEGTTSDGNRVLPFKTALFGAAQASLRRSQAEAVWVQPVCVAYTKVNGMPMGHYGRPLAAWPGDVELMPHLLAFLREGAVDAEIRFGEPIRFDAASDRKAVARRCESVVAALMARSLRGDDDRAA